MSDRAGDPRGKQHSLSDWLVLHELDPTICRRILDTMEPDPAAVSDGKDLTEYQVIEPAVAWQNAVDAMREFLPARKDIIDDTFENAIRIAVDEPDKPRKALTVDNGPEAYPTILFSYRGEPIDALAIAHEFAHAVQIMGSQGRFVPPITRETCAFLGETALLSHARRGQKAQHKRLVQAWEKANHRHFGVQKERLKTALSTSNAPYKYAWNYPIARYLAARISDRFSQDRIWSVFQGKLSVKEIVRELHIPVS